MIVDGVHRHQHMALGLHEGAHDAEGANSISVLHHKAGDDGVIGPLPSGQAVVAVLLQGEVGAPVL